MSANYFRQPGAIVSTPDTAIGCKGPKRTHDGSESIAVHDPNRLAVIAQWRATAGAKLL